MKTLKDAVKDQELTFGAKQTIKKIKTGELKQIFIARDCPEELRVDVLRFAKMAGVEVSEEEITGHEIGAICKKAFSINVLCF
ncbi:50S ribosomal protein L30e [archaeon]|jgi:large subunit ribosomal protein L30e|nr:50S ribosomal protein L30e [archaeon]MBT4417070.1 50S ribosomal protein L30e [archaeon]